MIEKMKQTIEFGNFETDVYLNITNFHLLKNCLKLVCSIYTDDEEEKLIDQWLITCLDYEEYRLDSLGSYEQE